MKKEIHVHYFAELVGKIVNDPIFSGGWPKGGYKITIETNESARTPTQNKCLHLWCDLQADVMNNCGFEQIHWLELTKEGLEFPWNGKSVKENMFRPILKALTGKDSTTAMNTVEPNIILDPLHRRLSGLKKPVPCLPWPDRFNR